MQVAEIIWVRAVNLDGCITVSSFELIIDTVPIYTEVPLFQVCDVIEITGPNDGLEPFDLDSQNIDIATVGGIFNPDLTVTYHLHKQMQKLEQFLLYQAPIPIL